MKREVNLTVVLKRVGCPMTFPPDVCTPGKLAETVSISGLMAPKRGRFALVACIGSFTRSILYNTFSYLCLNLNSICALLLGNPAPLSTD